MQKLGWVGASSRRNADGSRAYRWRFNPHAAEKQGRDLLVALAVAVVLVVSVGLLVLGGGKSTGAAGGTSCTSSPIGPGGQTESVCASTNPDGTAHVCVGGSCQGGATPAVSNDQACDATSATYDAASCNIDCPYSLAAPGQCDATTRARRPPRQPPTRAPRQLRRSVNDSARPVGFKVSPSRNTCSGDLLTGLLRTNQPRACLGRACSTLAPSATPGEAAGIERTCWQARQLDSSSRTVRWCPRDRYLPLGEARHRPLLPCCGEHEGRQGQPEADRHAEQPRAATPAKVTDRHANKHDGSSDEESPESGGLHNT